MSHDPAPREKLLNRGAKSHFLREHNTCLRTSGGEEGGGGENGFFFKKGRLAREKGRSGKKNERDGGRKGEKSSRVGKPKVGLRGKGE